MFLDIYYGLLACIWGKCIWMRSGHLLIPTMCCRQQYMYSICLKCRHLLHIILVHQWVVDLCYRVLSVSYEICKFIVDKIYYEVFVCAWFVGLFKYVDVLQTYIMGLYEINRRLSLGEMQLWLSSKCRCSRTELYI